MGRHLAANAMTFLIVGLVLLMGLITWGQTTFSGPGPAPEETIVEIPRGANLNRVTSELQDAGVISNGSVFRIGLRYMGLEDDLKFGVYTIPAGASMREIAELVSKGAGSAARFQITFRVRASDVSPRIVDQVERVRLGEDEEIPARMARADALITGGESVELRLAIPEGLTSFQVVEGLRAIPYLSGAINEIPPEGMLAPDTIAFRQGADRAELVADMLARQSEILTAAWEARSPDAPVQSPTELLTLASIVEKETSVAEERPVVAGVFVNRLNQGILLQTDPTIIYGITRGQENLDRPIRRSDIDGRTEANLHGRVEYNTYQVQGLPPGPIANPGRAAIEAAANPAETNFLFFVADGSGGHAFAETLEEHNANVAKWREIEAERAQDN